MTVAEPRTARYDRWTRSTERPLLVMAFLFLVAYAVPILAPGAPTPVLRAARAYEWLVWLVFAIDYVVRLTLTVDRRSFVRTHLLDLAAVALPMFRALRLLRLLSVVTLLSRRGSTARIQNATSYVLGFAMLLIAVSSLAVLDAERGADKAQIQSFGDSLWWSLVTMTTVGYGDVVPVTTTGKLVGAVVMLTGIAVLGVVTANVSSAFVAGLPSRDEVGRDATAAMERLEAQVARLSAELASARTSASGPGTGHGQDGGGSPGGQRPD